MTDTLPPVTFASTLDRITASREANARMRRPHRRGIDRPPGPPRADIWRGIARREVPSLAFVEQFAAYQPMAYVRMPRGDLYVVNDPDVIWEVFVGDSGVIKGFGLQQARAVVGDGILTSEGDKHRRHRAMVQPAFTGRRIAGYGDDMLSAIEATDARWQQLADAGPGRMELVDEMTTLTLDIVGRTLFGTDLAAVSAEVAPALARALGVFNRTMNPQWELQSRYPSRSRRTLTESVDVLDGVVGAMIQQKRAELARGDAPHDMMSVLIEATDPQTGAGLTDNELRDEVMTLMLAGHETTSMLLSWTWLLLFRNPEWKRWVAQEWDAAPELDVAAVSHLPRTRAVLAEAMRLYPPAWVIDRLTTVDIEAGGYVIPEGEAILASQWNMHRDARFWPQVRSFRPDRWIASDGGYTEKIVPRGVYFPFGFAARKCIGDRFALTEAALALAHLGRRWHVIPVASRDVVPEPTVTLRPSTSLPSLLRRR